MRMIRLGEAAVGKPLGKTIFAADGRILLQAGVIMTEDYVARLWAKGYRSIFIQDEFAQDIAVDDPVSEQTRLQTAKEVKETMDRQSLGLAMDSSKIKTAVKAIIAELQGNSHMLAGLSTIRSFDDYTFAHSVNVCTLSLVLGISLYYDYDQLYELGVGAILHDIGKTLIPLPVLQKQSRLDEAEWEVVKKHTDYGFEILRQDYEISLLSAHVAFQHHEKFDGSGYPRRMRGESILETARVAAIADVYDAITNDRVYRPRLPLHQAYNIIIQSADTHFDRRLVQRFLERVLLFPNGTIVRLNNGQVGIIARQEERLNSRPVVRLLTDTQQKLQPERPEVRLLQHPELSISEVLSDYPFPV